MNREEARTYLGVSEGGFQKLTNDGKIKKIKRGFYDKASIEKYKIEIEERKKIQRAIWKTHGGGSY